MMELYSCAINSIIIILNIINPIYSIISSHERNVFNQALYPLSQQSPDHCYRTSKCRTLNTSQCLDVMLPYKFTSSNVLENHAFSEIHDYLSRWKGLRSIPQCWKALQSVLCATFFPRCDNESSRVSLPTHEMCRLTRGPCRLIELHYEWPEFLRCDNETLFPPKCKNEYTDLKFNTSAVAKCSPPLVSSDDSNIWYPGIEGCALQCHNPIYTEEAHRKMSSFISHAATISLIATLFAVSTFIIDWRSSNRYPAVIIFYLNMCFLMSNMGWLLQSVLSKGKNEIVCRSDNTSRYGEPGTPENFYCLTVFLLIYYFSMAALVWFVNLAFAWDLSFQTTSSQRDSVNSKVAYFHLTAWSVPLMLTITILALGEVDGDSLRGICFVGYLKPVMRICFVLVPTTVSLIIGCFYMFKAMLTLIKVKLMNKSQRNSHRNRSKKIEHMIFRIAFFVTFAIIAVICNYVSHIYEFTHSPHWKRSLNDYIICTLNMTAALYPESELSEQHFCKLVERPNLMYAYFQLISVFGAGIVTSTWVWTSNSLAGWKRFIIRHLKPDMNEPIRLKRHEMISKVFNRRHQLSQGCYSPSFHSMHDDPVGMNLNSAASQDLSATWAAALPNFMYRRGGIIGNGNDTHYLPNFVNTRHSSTSDISQQRSFDSFISQRRSHDSQVSLEQLEMVAMARHQRRKTKKEREKLLKAHNSYRAYPYHLPLRRGSDTSGSAISTALAARGLTKATKSETKSTSTGDLVALAQMQMSSTQHYLTPTLATPSSLALHPHSTLPFMNPTALPRQRLSKPSVTNFTFTHGMSDQSNHLTNPLVEKRRPDSCAHSMIDKNMSNAQQVPHSTPNGSLIHATPQFTGTNPLSNYGITYMNGVNYATPAPSINYFNPMNAYYGNMLANGQPNPPMAAFPNFIAPQYPTTPLPGMQFAQQFPYNGLQAHYSLQQQCNNLHDIQSIIREREAYLPLIAPMDSSSEVGDFFPIQMSDSEGVYSEAVSRNEDFVTAQQIVDEHIQRVEAAVEANNVSSNGHPKHSKTIVGALGEGLVGDVLEMKHSKSHKSEKRKKKKSSKKHKTQSANGHVLVPNEELKTVNQSVPTVENVVNDGNTEVIHISN